MYKNQNSTLTYNGTCSRHVEITVKVETYLCCYICTHVFCWPIWFLHFLISLYWPILRLVSKRSLQNGGDCFCGNVLDIELYNTRGYKHDKSECNSTCKGNDDEKCGSNYQTSVYKLKGKNTITSVYLFKNLTWDSFW